MKNRLDLHLQYGSFFSTFSLFAIKTDNKKKLVSDTSDGSSSSPATLSFFSSPLPVLILKFNCILILRGDGTKIENKPKEEASSFEHYQPFPQEKKYDREFPR